LSTSTSISGISVKSRGGDAGKAGDQPRGGPMVFPMTITRRCDSAVVRKAVDASITMLIDVSNPNVEVGAAQVVVDRLGTPRRAGSLLHRAFWRPQRVVAADATSAVSPQSVKLSISCGTEFFFLFVRMVRGRAENRSAAAMISSVSWALSE